MPQPDQSHATRAALVARWMRRFVLAIALSCVSSGFGKPGSDEAKEYPVKAAMMGKFLKYVDWPTTRVEEDETPMIVGVFGADPFGKAIDTVFVGQTYRGHPYQVRRVETLADVPACHVLFIPKTEVEQLDAIVRVAAGKSILLVGESEGFARRGGIINFYFEKKNPRFEVNPQAAKREELKISSSLLKLARIVKEEK